MKIAYLLGSLNRGGMETLLLDLFRNNQQVPYDMLCFYRKGGRCEADFQNSGVQMVALSPYFGMDPLYIATLRHCFLKERVDIVHAQQSIDLIYAKLACLGTRIRVVQTYHGYAMGVSKNNLRIMKKAALWSDTNIYVSNHQKQYYLDMFHMADEEREQVVYNGIDFSKIPLVHHKELHQPLRMGMVGNFVRGRNQMVVCRALALLKEAGIEFHFQFVGAKSSVEPERYEACVAYCQEHGLSEQVEFMGARDDVPKLLSEWDAFLYATDHDTFGIAVIEAISSGLPTFVNDWAVMCEVTQNGILTHLYVTGKEETLCEAIMEWVSNKEFYAMLAYQSAQKVRQIYSIKNYAVRLFQVYEYLITK